MPRVTRARGYCEQSCGGVPGGGSCEVVVVPVENGAGAGVSGEGGGGEVPNGSGTKCGSGDGATGSRCDGCDPTRSIGKENNLGETQKPKSVVNVLGHQGKIIKTLLLQPACSDFGM